MAPSDSIRRMLQVASVEPALSVGAVAGQEWRTALRAKLWELLGGHYEHCEHCEQVDPDVTVVARYREDGYTRTLLRYRTEPAVRMSAWLLEPEAGGQLRPGFLALHGHGRGKDDVIGLVADDDPDARNHVQAHNYDYAVQLVRRGYVVLAPDARGFGESQAEGCHVAGLVSLYQGRPLAGQRLSDDLRALDILADLPGVDGERLACGGLSEGGKRTLLLAAVDERVQAAVISGYFTSLRAEIAAWDRLAGWDICNAIPGLLRWADLPDVAALIAPRDLVIEIGRDDPLYTMEGVRSGFETLRRVWRAADAEDSVCLDEFDGAHRWHGAACYDRLDRILQPE